MMPFGVTSDTIRAAMWASLNLEITVPTDFHGQCSKIKDLYANDSSGLIDSLTDFQVECALTDYTIETEDPTDVTYANLLNTWITNINSTYRGRPGVVVGLRGFAKQYFIERWKYSSFPIIQIASFKKVIKVGNNSITVPEGLFVLDGGAVYAESPSDEGISLFSTKYFLGNAKSTKREIKGRNYLITKPNGRMHDEYPIPYLFRRGAYVNWLIQHLLKNKQTQLVKEILPYLLSLEKSGKQSDGQVKKYSENALESSADKVESALLTSKRKGKTPIRVGNAGDKFSDYVPQIENMMKEGLFVQSERAQLSALGFIEMQALGSTTRQEAVFNPKPFIAEVNSGIADFKAIVSDLIAFIEEDNTNIKLKASKAFVSSAPIDEFMTDGFKKKLSELHSRGNLSNQTYMELVGDVKYDIEKKRRIRESKDGSETIFYPPIIQNQEDKGVDFSTDFDKSGQPILEDRKPGDPATVEKFSQASLVAAPYLLSNPPKQILKYPKSAQKVFTRVFNNTLKTSNDEIKAFRTAWTALKQKMKKLRASGAISETAMNKLEIASVDHSDDGFEV